MLYNNSHHEHPHWLHLTTQTKRRTHRIHTKKLPARSTFFALITSLMKNKQIKTKPGTGASLRKKVQARELNRFTSPCQHTRVCQGACVFLFFPTNQKQIQVPLIKPACVYRRTSGAKPRRGVFLTRSCTCVRIFSCAGVWKPPQPWRPRPPRLIPITINSPQSLPDTHSCFRAAVMWTLTQK